MNQGGALGFVVAASLAGCVQVVEPPEWELTMDVRHGPVDAKDSRTGTWLVAHLRNDGRGAGHIDSGCLGLDLAFAYAPGPPANARCNAEPLRAQGVTIRPGMEESLERFFSGPGDMGRRPGAYVASADVYAWEQGMVKTTMRFYWDGSTARVT